MASSLKKYLLSLDLFGSSIESNEQENGEQRRWSIIATRLYLLILLIILPSVVTLSWLSTEVVTITIRYPTKEFFEYLPHDTQCPCSRGSVSYDDFTSLEPRFHQVCSSDFVSDEWIQAIFSGCNSTYFHVDDFRRFGSGQFQALASFCRLSMTNIEESISAFKLTTLISLNVLPEMVLRQQTVVAIDQFTSIANQRFASQLDLILQMTIANMLVSGLQVNHRFQYNLYESELRSISIYPRIISQDGHSICNCLLTPHCKSAAVFDEIFGAANQEHYLTPISLPGLSSGCLPVSSMLSSTLECFYNQTCVDNILSAFRTTARFSAMDSSQESTYSPTSTVQSMVDRLMVENWTIDISYEKYYAQCAPASCTYSQTKRNGLISGLITLISSLATLTFVLKIFIRHLIAFIRARLNPQPSPRIPISERLRIIKRFVSKLVIDWNMFETRRAQNQPIRRQLYATRLYIFMLIASLMILSVYTLLSESVYRQKVLNPSESEYLQLEQAYPNTLSCPCRSINMSYATFVTSEPHYHQVCSSDLITAQWLEYSLSGIRDAKYIYDYRINAAVQFKTLAFLCEFAQHTVDDALGSFLRTELVGSQVIQSKLFEGQMYSLIKEMNSTTLNQFVRAIQLIRNTTHSNQLLNRLNIYLLTNNNPRMVSIHPRDYQSCPCAFSRTCRGEMGMYLFNITMGEPILIHKIPNFFVSCYLVDALFMSTLECFYNETCMLAIDQYLDSSMRQSIHFPALNATMNLANENVEAIVNRLMLDSWLSSVNFSSYYETCAPSACTFEYKSRNGLLATVTTILGVFGGLSLGYKLIILVGLRIIEEIANGLSTDRLIQFQRRLFSCENDEKQIYRLHIILVIVTLCSLCSTITFTPKQITIETEKPSLSDYRQLIERYSGAVQCSCSRLSIKHQSFLELKARFHPICNDGFISRYWYFLWSNGPLIYRLVSRDYVYSGSGQVLAIISFCDLSQQVVTDSFRRLLSSDFISAQLLSSDLLYQRMRKMIDDFLRTLPKSTINTLSLIRETTSANMIMNTLSNNWVFTVDNVQNDWPARTRPVIYPGCTCGASDRCTDTVLGVRYGCYVIEALWETTFEVFYDSRRLGLNLSFPMLNITANPTRFGINATIGSVVNELMVEEFSSNISYENYFAECAPSLCISSYIKRSHVVEGITVVVSLYGGLMIICQVIAMIIVKIFRCKKNNTYPIIQ